MMDPFSLLKVVFLIVGTQLPVSQSIEQVLPSLIANQCDQSTGESFGAQKYIQQSVGCPVGYWKVPSGSDNSCYKLYVDHCHTWSNAQQVCKNDGGNLATPTNPVALRFFTRKTFGNHFFWLGAQGNGHRQMAWVETNNNRNRDPLEVSSNLWYPGQPSNTSPASCLLLLAIQLRPPIRPYYTLPCERVRLYALCESPANQP